MRNLRRVERALAWGVARRRGFEGLPTPAGVTMGTRMQRALKVVGLMKPWAACLSTLEQVVGAFDARFAMRVPCVGSTD